MRNSIFTTAALFATLSFWEVSGQTRVDVDTRDAQLSGTFIFTNGYLVQTNRSSDPTNSGLAILKFQVPNAGDYAIRARVELPDNQAGAFFVNVDGEASGSQSLWEIPAQVGAADIIVTSNGGKAGTVVRQKVFKLAAGAHELRICGCSADTKLSGICLLQVPAPPTGLRVVSEQR